jgi:predicted HAD superfamily phosphohydrolase
MLLLAIWKRVAQYGITEKRYLLSILALWLASVAVYYAVSRSRNIKVIPGSLAALAFFSFIGPWSAYATSLRSQLGRLAGSLERHGVLVDGRVVPTTAEIPEDDRREITGALRYVIQFHGTGPIDDWFSDGVAAIDTIGDGTKPSNNFMSLQRASILMRHMGIEPVDAPSSATDDFRHYTAAYPRPPLDVAGFDWGFPAVPLQGFSQTIGLDSLALSFGVDDLMLRLDRNGEEVIARSLEPFLERIARSLDVPRGLAVPTDSLRIDAEGTRYAVRIYVTQVTVDARTDPLTIAGATGDVFLRLIDLETTALPDR